MIVCFLIFGLLILLAGAMGLIAIAVGEGDDIEDFVNKFMRSECYVAMSLVVIGSLLMWVGILLGAKP